SPLLPAPPGRPTPPPIPPSHSLPSTSRQRFRRSASLVAAIGRNSYYLCQDGKHQLRALLINRREIRPRGHSDRAAAGSAAHAPRAQALALVAHRPPLGAVEAGEGAAQQREHRNERLGCQLTQPGVERQPEAILIEQALRAAAQHALYPGGRLFGRDCRRERETRQPAKLRLVHRSAIKQQAAAESAYQPVDRLAVHQPA